MSRRRKSTDTTPFDTLRLEGTLFVPELLERAASGDATAQKEADYLIPKGLKLHDEYGRAFRIATASWQAFVPQLARKDLDPAAVTQSFVIDLLRQCFNYADLAPLRDPVQLGDRGFPVTAQALAGRLPVIIAPHALGLDDPDPRFAIVGSGSKKKSAHQLAQEFLNASSTCLWAIVTNGKTLRLLRDADTLTRPNFLEFDLETILRDDQHHYADFSALWRIIHASRAGASSASPAECIWEKWKTEGHAQGLRVRDGLRDGVQEALLILGAGFLTHPDNTLLRQRLQEGTLTKDAYFQQLLRLIYRCLFLFCAEERQLLHPPLPEDEKSAAAALAARKAYATGYGLRRFRSRALRQSAHDPHGDLWQSIRIVFRGLSVGQPRLALPALGGLFAETQCADLDIASLTNRDLLSAMKNLRWFIDKKSGQRGAIDYRNMGPEELGSVYESLLELVPQLDLPARTFGFAGITDTASTSGNARKTTGSYYTPDSLVQELIKSALDPVIADRLAAQPDRPIDALLSITVCDPSCGSGHFLLAAARRLAEKLAELRAPDGAVRPDDYRHALREVASRCLYGVDINPMAVELCRVALWLETVDPGKPLGFLNHHIRTGNSLLGTTPDLIAAGLPDDTFTAIEGDDKAACAELKKRNKKEREGFGPLFEQEEQTIRDRLRHAATQIEAMDDSQPAALQQKEAAFTTSETAPEYRHAKLLADLWCAAFVIKKTYPTSESPSIPPQSSQSGPSPISDLPSPIEGHLLHTQDELFGQPTAAPAPAKAAKKPKLETLNLKLGTPSGITTGTLRDFVQGKPLSADLQTEVEALARQYHFFHWHLAFPQIFDQGGFACILGNPPWERVKFQEREWFATRCPEIATANTASQRTDLISLLKEADPNRYREYFHAQRAAEAEANFAMKSGRYQYGAQGDTNTYPLFVELTSQVISDRARAGIIVKTGILADFSLRTFFRHLVDSRRLISGFDFSNRRLIFPAVVANERFTLLTIGGAHTNSELIHISILNEQVSDLQEPGQVWALTPADVAAINPNTRTCPLFQTASDAMLVSGIYRRNAVMVNEEATASGNDWGILYLRMLDMTLDSNLFRDLEALQGVSEGPPSPKWKTKNGAYVSLLEGKLFDSFDAHHGTFDGIPRSTRFGIKAEPNHPSEVDRTDPDFCCLPRYWVPETEVFSAYSERIGFRPGGVLSFRDVCRTHTDFRTVRAAICPALGAGNKAPLLLFPGETRQEHATRSSLVCAMLNSFVLDYVARQKFAGGSLNKFVLIQFPMVARSAFTEDCAWQSQPLPTAPTLCDWLLPRVLELTYTAWDLEAFAADCGWSGPPFRWDEERRFLLRCELDAAFFHLYLGPQSEWQQQPEALTRAFPTPRHAVSYIMDTFPIVKRKDEAKHGHYRTKETILQIYDALGESMQNGLPYQSILIPPPADPSCCHPSRTTQ